MSPTTFSLFSPFLLAFLYLAFPHVVVFPLSSHFSIPGAVTSGDRILVMPAGHSGQVKSVAADDVPVDYGFAGDQVVVTLTGVNETSLGVGTLVLYFEAETH